jgi:CSLREA domain-containing protein
VGFLLVHRVVWRAAWPAVFVVAVATLVAGPVAPAAEAAPAYSIVQIGTGALHPNALNNLGEVVGATPPGDLPWAWKDGSFLQLDAPPQGWLAAGNDAGYKSGAVDVNDLGQVLGAFSQFCSSSCQADTSLGVWDASGKLQFVGPMGTTNGPPIAIAINNRGDVLGGVESATDNLSVPDDWFYLPAGGAATTLPFTGNQNGPCCLGWLDLNDHGEALAVGGPLDSADKAQSYTWSGAIAGPIDIEPAALNDNGVIVGLHHFPDESAFVARGALYENGQIVDMGTSTDVPQSNPTAINNHDEVVGDNATSQEPFLWSEGTFVALQSLLPSGSGWTLQHAIDINDRGQIVGTGTLNGHAAAFLMTPPPVSVNSTGDESDQTPMDGVCDTGPAVGGVVPCTLRGAIQTANEAPGETIKFNIPTAGAVARIAPNGALPEIAVPVTIDGSTEPLAGMVQLDGIDAPAGANGLVLRGGNSTVRGLVIDGWQTGDGILIEGGGADKIAGDYIGTNATGTLAAGNLLGVRIRGSANNVIGGTSPADRNVISGNGINQTFLTAIKGKQIDPGQLNAVLLSDLYGGGVGISDAGASHNVVEGDYIGPDATGSVAIPDAIGVEVGGQTGPVSGNVIGGSTSTPGSGAGNVISGDAFGVVSLPRTGAGAVVQGLSIQGNLIGLNASGTGPLSLGNIPFGNYVGALTGGALDGLQVGGGSPALGNVVSGNVIGVAAAASDPAAFTHASIQGNRFGVDLAGNTAVPNVGAVALAQTQAVQVGGPLPADGNVMAGGHLQVLVMGPDASGNTIANNTIGVTAALTGPVTQAAPGPTLGVDGEQQLGVLLATGAHNNTIGPGNLLSWSLAGVYMVGAPSNTVIGNQIDRNVIGTFVFRSPQEQIGGSAAGQGNTITRDVVGVALDNEYPTLVGRIANDKIDEQAFDALIQDPNLAIPFDAIDSEVGGDVQAALASATAPTSASVLAAAPDSYVRPGARPRFTFLVPTQGYGNVVEGNFIGTQAPGPSTAPFGDVPALVGVAVGPNVSDSEIGGIQTGQANTIANNLLGGVQIGYRYLVPPDSQPTGIRVRGNSIFGSNGLTVPPGLPAAGSYRELGIHLVDAVEPLKLLTIVSGQQGLMNSAPNDFQNFPTLASATSAGANTSVAGDLSSLPHSSFALDFYASSGCHPSGYGEGQQYLGTVTVTTDGTGTATFTHALNAATKRGEVVTATATGKYGTSEFSKCVTVSGTATGAAAPISGSFTANTAMIVAYTAPGPAGAATFTLDSTTGSATAAAFTARSRTVRLGKVAFRTRPGHLQRVRIRLTRAGRRFVKHRHSIVARVTVTVTTRKHRAQRGAFALILRRR